MNTQNFQKDIREKGREGGEKAKNRLALILKIMKFSIFSEV